MAGAGIEVAGSRHITNQGAERQYLYEGAASEDDVITFIQGLAEVTSGVAGFPFADFEAQEHEENVGDYDVTVKFGSGSAPAASAGSSAYKFSFQAPSANIKQSLATISIDYDVALLPFGAASFGGAINVVWDDGKQRVEGLQLQAPAEVFTIPYTDVDAVITSGYQATVRDLCGKVNNSTFMGLAAGQVMLVRAVGEKKGGLWNLEFGFGYIKNSTSIPVGDVIVVSAKDGMDLLWPYYLPTLDGTTKQLLQRPAAALVERVFERADLNDLDLP